LRASDEKDKPGEADGKRDDMPSGHRTSQEEPPRDDDQAGIDVDDQHDKRSGQCLQRGEVGERLGRINDRAQGEQRKEPAAGEAHRILA